MKRRFRPAVFVFIALAVLIVVAGCSNNAEEPKKDYEHSYVLVDSKWVSDESGHWHVLKCECGDEKKVDIASHTFGDETTTTGTCIKPGTESASCTICGYTKEEKIKNHTFNSDTVPTCTLCGGYKVGDNVAGVYNSSTKTLTVTGTGYMDEKYTREINGSKSPWESHDITTVIIEDGVTSVSAYAFADDESITEVILGKDLIKLETAAFRDTKISSIVLPDGLEIIDYGAFSGTDITELNIPSKVVIKGEYAFWDIGKLVSLNIDSNNVYAQSIDGVAYSKDRKTLLAVPAGKTDYTIRAGITKIGESAFESWTGKEIEIPSSVTEIGEYAFYSSENLEKVRFNEGLKTIAADAFSSCGILEIELPSTVETIEEYAFYESSLTKISIGNSIKSIGEGAFSSCDNLTTIKIDRPSSEKSSLDTENDKWGAGSSVTVIWSDSSES